MFHDQIDPPRLAQPHAIRLVFDPAAKVHRISFRRNGDDLLREQGAPFRADVGLVAEPIDDRRFDFVPVNPLLPLAVAFYAPVLAAVPCQPTVHHDHQHVVPRGLADTGGRARLFAQGHHARAQGVVADGTTPGGGQGRALLEGAGFPRRAT